MCRHHNHGFYSQLQALTAPTAYVYRGLNFSFAFCLIFSTLHDTADRWMSCALLEVFKGICKCMGCRILCPSYSCFVTVIVLVIKANLPRWNTGTIQKLSYKHCGVFQCLRTVDIQFWTWGREELEGAWIDFRDWGKPLVISSQDTGSPNLYAYHSTPTVVRFIVILTGIAGTFSLTTQESSGCGCRLFIKFSVIRCAASEEYAW